MSPPPYGPRAVDSVRCAHQICHIRCPHLCRSELAAQTAWNNCSLWLGRVWLMCSLTSNSMKDAIHSLTTFYTKDIRDSYYQPDAFMQTTVCPVSSCLRCAPAGITRCPGLLGAPPVPLL